MAHYVTLMILLFVSTLCMHLISPPSLSLSLSCSPSECLWHGRAPEVPAAQPGPVSAVQPIASHTPPSSLPAATATLLPARPPLQSGYSRHHILHILGSHHHPQGRPPLPLSGSRPDCKSQSNGPAGPQKPVVLQPGPGPLPVWNYPWCRPAPGNGTFRLPAGLLHRGGRLAGRVTEFLQLRWAGRGNGSGSRVFERVGAALREAESPLRAGRGQRPLRNCREEFLQHEERRETTKDLSKNQRDFSYAENSYASAFSGCITSCETLPLFTEPGGIWYSQWAANGKC